MTLQTVGRLTTATFTLCALAVGAGVGCGAVDDDADRQQRHDIAGRIVRVD